MHVEHLAWISFLRIWNFWYSADFSSQYGSWLLDFMAKSWVYREVISIQWIKSKKAFNQSEKFQCKFSCNLRTIFGNIIKILMEFSAKSSFNQYIQVYQSYEKVYRYWYPTHSSHSADVYESRVFFSKSWSTQIRYQILAKPIFEKLCVHLNTFASW